MIAYGRLVVVLVHGDVEVLVLVHGDDEVVVLVHGDVEVLVLAHADDEVPGHDCVVVPHSLCLLAPPVYWIRDDLCVDLLAF